MSKTLFEKIWNSHVVEQLDEDLALIYIDLHLVHEVTSPQAFESLRINSRKVRRPDLTVATIDHNVPTLDRFNIKDPISMQQIETLRKNCEDFKVPIYDIDNNGIINESDIEIYIYYLMNEEGVLEADINHDSAVDIFDLLILCDFLQG